MALKKFDLTYSVQVDKDGDEVIVGWDKQLTGFHLVSVHNISGEYDDSQVNASRVQALKEHLDVLAKRRDEILAQISKLQAIEYSAPVRPDDLRGAELHPDDEIPF